MNQHNKNHPHKYKPRKFKLSPIHLRIFQYAKSHDGPISPRGFMREAGISEQWSYVLFKMLRKNEYLRVSATPIGAPANSFHWYELTEKGKSHEI